MEGQTIRDLWDGHIRTMGSGSDFTAFQDFAGVSSIDVGFSRGPRDPVYHYHSNYDSFTWMDKYGDHGWHYHTAVTKVLSLLAAKLVETPVLAFNATDYADGLRTYLGSIRVKAATTASKEAHLLIPLEEAIAELRKTSVEFEKYTGSLTARLAEHPPWWKWWQKARLYYEIRRANDKYKLLERKFLYEGGLDGRPWFRHVVFAPGIWTGYAGLPPSQSRLLTDSN